MRLGGRLLLCSLLLAGPVGSAPNAESASGFIQLQSLDVRFDSVPDIPGLSVATLSGDPKIEGIYVIRLRISPGVTFPPHYHDQVRHVTVIAGVWAFGIGFSGECEDTMPVTAGAYGMQPKGEVHFDGACGEEPVEVQIIGLGPVATEWVEKTD